MALSVGSARVRITPARSIARKVPDTELNRPATLVVLIVWSAAENGLAVAKLTTAAPLPSVPERSMPSCLMMSRWTSATVTLSITCWRPRITMPLTTLVLSPTRRPAMS
jgi:hypothetical protein